MMCEEKVTILKEITLKHDYWTKHREQKDQGGERKNDTHI